MNGDFPKIQLLTGWEFKTPTASWVLSSVDRDRHAIVDTRVRAALERQEYLEGRKETFGPDDYVTMIESIREMGAETSYRPVKIGDAFVAYDDRVYGGTLHRTPGSPDRQVKPVFHPGEGTCRPGETFRP